VKLLDLWGHPEVLLFEGTDDLNHILVTHLGVRPESLQNQLELMSDISVYQFQLE